MNSQQQVCQIGDIKTDEICGNGYRAEIGIDVTNHRLKILSFQGINFFDLVQKTKELSHSKNLGKVLINVKKEKCTDLERAGYVLEGTIPGFFSGENAYCYSYFSDPSRAKSMYLEKENDILEEVTGNKVSSKTEELLPPGFQLRKVIEADVLNLVNLYKGVFASYPSPLFDPNSIRKVIQKEVHFMAIFDKDGLPVSAGSADMDLKNSNAEITDLATEKKVRGLGFAITIMMALEKEMWQRQFKCLYSLSRAGIPGVNRALFKLCYSYHGRLLNNCHIDGRFENMNIWVKNNPVTSRR